MLIMWALSRVRRGRSVDGMATSLTVLRVVGLAALSWAVANEHRADGAPSVPVWLLGAVAVSWLGWMLARRTSHSPTVFVMLMALAGFGGATAGLAPVGIAFPAIAVLAAWAATDLPRVVAVAATGLVAVIATAMAAHAPAAVPIEAVLAIAAAGLGGASRRQFQDRAAHAEQLLAEQQRADAERDRAAALAERNRIGREVHDVLAHSLGALSVQLEAADALLENRKDADDVRPLLQQARRLAVEGLAETRAAVHALRDEPVALPEQLQALANAAGATLVINGAPRPLPPDSGLTLYRAAQEEVSNARKHAPGAAVTITLTWGAGGTTLDVTNAATPDDSREGTLATTGSGMGLRGMRERVELLGGRFSAGPHERGWAVHIAVPT